jgi:hypothetical protein
VSWAGLLEPLLGWAGWGEREARDLGQTSRKVQYVVQLKAPITDAGKAALLGCGVPLTLGPYVPHNAFLVTAAVGAEARLEKCPGVVHVSRLLSADKHLDTESAGKGESVGEGSVSAPPTRTKLLIHLADGHHDDQATVQIALGEWERLLPTLGVVNVSFSAHSGTFVVGIVAKHDVIRCMEFLTHRNEVVWVERAKRFKSYNKHARAVTQSRVGESDSMWAHGLRGEGQVRQHFTKSSLHVITACYNFTNEPSNLSNSFDPSNPGNSDNPANPTYFLNRWWR